MCHYVVISTFLSTPQLKQPTVQFHFKASLSPPRPLYAEERQMCTQEKGNRETGLSSCSRLFHTHAPVMSRAFSRAIRPSVQFLWTRYLRNTSFHIWHTHSTHMDHQWGLFIRDNTEIIISSNYYKPFLVMASFEPSVL